MNKQLELLKSMINNKDIDIFYADNHKQEVYVTFLNKPRGDGVFSILWLYTVKEYKKQFTKNTGNDNCIIVNEDFITEKVIQDCITQFSDLASY